MGLQTSIRHAFPPAKVGEITFLNDLCGNAAPASRRTGVGPQVEASHSPLRLVVEGHQSLQSDAPLAPLTPLATYLNRSLVPAVHLKQIQRKRPKLDKVAISSGMLVCQKFQEILRFVNFWCLKVLEPLAFPVCIHAHIRTTRLTNLGRAWPAASKRQAPD